MKVGISPKYLSNDLRIEKKTLSEELYTHLCSLANINFDIFIEKRLDEHWGRSKGGINSTGSTRKIREKIPRNIQLAELVGIILGDGNITSYRRGNQIGVYQIKIAGHLKDDEEYHLKYIKPLFEEIFDLETKEMIGPSERFISLYSKKAVEFLGEMNLNPGDKIKNQSTIPKWILANKDFTRACLRGLIDTDGCIHRMSNRDFNLLRINFTNHNKTLLKDVRKAFIDLGFNPSNIISERRFYLSRKIDIERYLKEIGFLNKKHIKRLREFKKVPWSSGQ
jgi:hypothetical protein